MCTPNQTFNSPVEVQDLQTGWAPLDIELNPDDFSIFTIVISGWHREKVECENMMKNMRRCEYEKM